MHNLPICTHKFQINAATVTGDQRKIHPWDQIGRNEKKYKKKTVNSIF